MTEQPQLEADLADVGKALDWPPTPDLVAAVLAEIEAPATRRRPAPRPWLRPGLAVAVVLAAAIVVGSLVPAVREQVAAWLGIGGVEIEAVDEIPAGLGAGLPLGEPATVAEAEALLGRALLVPEVLGAPDLVFIVDGRRAVSMVWSAGPGLPAADAGVGAVLTQFGGRVDVPVVSKLAGPDVVVEAVSVGGEPGLWITGGPHPVYYLGSDGEVIEDSGRLAGNTLLWEVGRTTLRLESALDQAAAVAVAESVG